MVKLSMVYKLNKLLIFNYLKKDVHIIYIMLLIPQQLLLFPIVKKLAII
jgi:hypothetical protein